MNLKTQAVSVAVGATVLVALTGPVARSQSTDCSITLQTQVDATPAGGTLVAPACLYRETVTIRRPLTIDGSAGTEIRGSDVWTDWTARGATWVSSKTVPNLPLEPTPNTDGRCGAAASAACLWPERVWQDGKLLPIQFPGTVPGPGQFAMDAGRHIVLGSNPGGHVLEVGTRERWIITASDNVTVQGFTMRQAVNHMQWPAVGNDSHDNWTLQDSKVFDTRGAPVSIWNGTNTNVLRNEIGYGGEMGISASLPDHLTISGNYIHHSGYDVTVYWGAAGIKLGGATNVSITDNEVAFNSGTGIWCDVACSNIVIKDNGVHDNAADGISEEISSGASIIGNSVWNNGFVYKQQWIFGAGILVHSASDVEVAFNNVAWNLHGISLVAEAGREAQGFGGVNIHDNVIAQQFRSDGYYWTPSIVAFSSSLKTLDLYSPTLVGGGPPLLRNNVIWTDRPDSCCPSRFSYRSGQWLIQRWATEAGDTSARYLSNSDARSALSAASIPVDLIAAGPTPIPTRTPTATPTSTPTSLPTSTPSPTATLAPPTATPTSTPVAEPTFTSTPTLTPTSTPTSTPTNTPTLAPTSTPTPRPTSTPTATATPVCYVWTKLDYPGPNDVLGWVQKPSNFCKP